MLLHPHPALPLSTAPYNMAQASHLVHHQISALEVVVTLCLTYTLCIFFLRLWMRRRLYGVDDLIALVATVSSFYIPGRALPAHVRDLALCFCVLRLTTFSQVLSIAQFATQYVALSNGLGRPSPYLATSPSLGTLNNVRHLSSWYSARPFAVGKTSC